MDRHGQIRTKRTKINRNGHKLTNTDRNRQSWTKTKRRGRRNIAFEEKSNEWEQIYRY